MRLLELAGMLLGRAGEGAALMAEQDRLDEIGGEGAAVDGDEGLRLALARPLDGAGDQFLADAALALDEDRDLRAGGAAGEGDHAVHRRARGDDVAEGEHAGGRAPRPLEFALQRA